MRRLGIAVLAALAFLSSAAAGEPARLDPAASRVTAEEGGIVLSLALDRAVPFRVFTLDAPPRLVVDFRELDFGAAAPAALDPGGAFASLRWGRFRPGWSRLVADLRGPYAVAGAHAETEGLAGARVTVRLVPTDAESFAAAARPPMGALWDLPEPAPLAAPKRRQTGEAPLVVVLDPGHGGIDPGAERGGTDEAALMLTFAAELRAVLAGAGMRVVMTREEDVFVPLETRISVARAAGADVFLSLHADALEEGEATGATVYTLAEGAADAASAALAERHDRADLLSGVDLGGQDDLVASVLMDMARAETAPRSARLARDLADAIRAGGGKMHRRPIQSGGFSVLKAADIPSALIELGFLSSEEDFRRLTDPAWRARMQAAILAGLRTWAEADAGEARLLRR